MAADTLHALGLVDDAERERFFRRLRGIASTSYAPFQGVQLERMVPAPRAPAVPGLHLLGAELYADGVVLRWVFIAPSADPGEGGEHRPPEAFSLWDDTGTAYNPQGGGWVPGHHLRGETAFVPAVPEGAERLFVAADRHRFELDLGPQPR